MHWPGGNSSEAWNGPWRHSSSPIHVRVLGGSIGKTHGRRWTWDRAWAVGYSKSGVGVKGIWRIMRWPMGRSEARSKWS